MATEFHPELRQLRTKLQEIYAASAHLHPLSLKPPILDSSVVIANEPSEDSPWTQQEQVPGLRQLRESIRLDLDVLDKVGRAILLNWALTNFDIHSVVPR